MNRPYFSFGALLAALVLTILAVSSSSRSTTVQQAAVPPENQPMGKGFDAARPSSPRPGNIYLIVLPAAEDSQFQECGEWPTSAVASSELPVPSYATGCGLDRLTGRLYAFATDDRTGWEFEDDCRQAWSRCMPGGQTEEQAQPASFATVQVKVAPHDAAELAEIAECSSFLSHHDAAYDRAVYGDFAGERTTGREAWNWPKLQIDPLALGEAAVRARQFAATWLSAPRCKTQQLDWSEYAAMVDAAIEQQAHTSHEAESPTRVPSSRWLLRFAASSLDRASVALGDMADALNEAAASGEAELASERSSSQR